ncbi:cytochrome P450 monooxygenase 59 [Asimina triloba]
MWTTELVLGSFRAFSGYPVFDWTFSCVVDIVSVSLPMVQKDFTAQTGDPAGKGTGGDSVYKFLYGDQARFFGDEIHPDLTHSKIGTVAMASAGENLNASQGYDPVRPV